MFQGSTQSRVSPQQKCRAWKGQTHVSLYGAGLFSSAMRDLANITHKGPKWIILDGDIDPMWIESLNTVMDDNKVGAITRQELCSLINSRSSACVHAWAPRSGHPSMTGHFPQVLTLASNERIPLNPTMRLLFEISHLRTATPATVSRAGILYINPTDLGWNL